MSLPHFYLEQQVLADETGEHIGLRLSADDARHFKVLRLKAGEHIAVIDAARDYFECEITDPNWDAPEVRICSHEADIVAGPSVVLVQGLAKSDKLDTIVRQATEVGVSGVVAVPFARSVVSLDERHGATRLARWETIVKNAAMQSGRRTIPEVALLTGVDDLEPYLAGATCTLIFWEEAPTDADFAEPLARALATEFCPAADARVAIIIGPEGGLEATEVERIKAMTKHPAVVTLGSTILRTETAGVVAPALVIHELNRLAKGSPA